MGGQLIQIPVMVQVSEFEWADISIALGSNAPLISVTDLAYSYVRKITNNYGAGSQPVSRSFCNVDYVASFTIYKSEMEILKAQAALFGGDITQLPLFAINVAYSNLGLPIVVEKLLNCSMMNYALNTKQNDSTISYKVDVIFAGLSV